ncbi:MAG: hypothetical protein RLZZ09_3638 [Pseudomonadota bacterium]|jgi:hypothetical protein
MATLQKSDLTPKQRQLVELMQDINFGRISDLLIKDGEPLFVADTFIEREIKFGGQNGPRPELAQDDFVLKHEVIVMLDHIAQIIDGCVGSLEIKHGLPFLMRIRTYLA